MKYKQFKNGEIIIKYGDVGKEYFVLIEGKVRVNVYEKETDPNIENLSSKIIFQKIMEQGVGFGELALLYNDKRSATIEAIEDCVTYVLEGSLFKNVVINSGIKKRTV